MKRKYISEMTTEEKMAFWKAKDERATKRRREFLEKLAKAAKADPVVPSKAAS